jgi:N-acetylneuraminic acid mutarotase
MSLPRLVFSGIAVAVMCCAFRVWAADETSAGTKRKADGAPPATKADGTPAATKADETSTATSASANLVSWTVIAELPRVPGQARSAGLSGIFAGALDDSHALVAGGSFYPDKGPLEGGQKAWTDAIMVLEQKPGPVGDQPVYQWVSVGTKLPRPLANGVSIALDDGVLCCGGADAQACYADVFLLQWNGGEKKIERVDFPPLPKPIAFAGGAKGGDWIFIAGGTTTPAGRSGADFFGLDLSQRGNPAAFQWQTLPVLPRTALFPVCSAQNDGTTDCFFLFGGRGFSSEMLERPLADGQKFIPDSQTWVPTGPVRTSAEGTPIALTGGAAVALEQNRILVLGGDDAEIARLLDANARHNGPPEQAEAYRKFNQALLAAHPGYRREMLLFDARRNEWKAAGVFPQGTPAVTPAFLWDGAVVLAGGESSPGQRSAKVWLGRFESP